MKNPFALAAIFSVLFSGCFKCDEPLTLSGAAITVYPFSTQANEYFYPVFTPNPPFHKDSVSVTDETGKSLQCYFTEQQDPRNSINRFYALSITNIFDYEKDNEAFSTEKQKKIYISYSRNLKDSLSLVFKAENGRCHSTNFEYLKVYEKGSLVSSETSNISSAFQINY